MGVCPSQYNLSLVMSRYSTTACTIYPQKPSYGSSPSLRSPISGFPSGLGSPLTPSSHTSSSSTYKAENYSSSYSSVNGGAPKRVSPTLATPTQAPATTVTDLEGAMLSHTLITFRLYVSDYLSVTHLEMQAV